MSIDTWHEAPLYDLTSPGTALAIKLGMSLLLACIPYREFPANAVSRASAPRQEATRLRRARAVGAVVGNTLFVILPDALYCSGVASEETTRMLAKVLVLNPEVMLVKLGLASAYGQFIFQGKRNIHPTYLAIANACLLNSFIGITVGMNIGLFNPKLFRLLVEHLGEKVSTFFFPLLTLILPVTFAMPKTVLPFFNQPAPFCTRRATKIGSTLGFFALYAGPLIPLFHAVPKEHGEIIKKIFADDPLCITAILLVCFAMAKLMDGCKPGESARTVDQRSAGVKRGARRPSGASSHRGTSIIGITNGYAPLLGDTLNSRRPASYSTGTRTEPMPGKARQSKGMR